MWEETHRLSSTCCTGEEGLLGSLERKVGCGGQGQGTKGLWPRAAMQVEEQKMSQTHTHDSTVGRASALCATVLGLMFDIPSVPLSAD